MQFVGVGGCLLSTDVRHQATRSVGCLIACYVERAIKPEGCSERTREEQEAASEKLSADRCKFPWLVQEVLSCEASSLRYNPAIKSHWNIVSTMNNKGKNKKSRINTEAGAGGANRRGA